MQPISDYALHINEYFPQGFSSISGAPNQIQSGSQFDYRNINNIFAKLYATYYSKNDEIDVNYSAILNNLSHKYYVMGQVNTYYLNARRIQNKLQEFLDVNRNHGFTGISIYEYYDKDYSEYKNIKSHSIVDKDYVVNSEVDASLYLGSDSPISALYSIFKINEINGYPAVSIEYEMFGFAMMNLFQTKFIAEKYEIDSIVFYSGKEVLTPTYSLEKFKDNVLIKFPTPVFISKILITYYITPLDSYSKEIFFTMGQSIYTYKREYSDINEMTIKTTGNNDIYLLEHTEFPSYHYLAGKSAKYSMPVVNEKNETKVFKLLYVDNSDQILINLYPIPEDMSMVRVFTDTLDISGQPEFPGFRLGNCFIVDRAFITKHHLDIGTKIHVEYVSGDPVNQYYDTDHILNRIIYNSKRDKVVVILDVSGSLGNTVGVDITNFYARKKNIIRDGKVIETIQYDPDDPNDYRDIKRVIYSENLYVYKAHEIKITGVGDFTVELPDEYMPSMAHVIGEISGEYVSLKHKDWTDVSLGDEKRKFITYTVENQLLDSVTIYYTPIYFDDTKNDYFSNIDHSKKFQLKAPITGGVCSIKRDDIHTDYYIYTNWILDGYIFRHPTFSTVYFSQFQSKYGIARMEYDDKNINVYFDDGSLEDPDHEIMTYSKDKYTPMILNPLLSVPEINPVLVLSK